MTADTLYQNALALIVTDKADSSDYTAFAPAVINLLLAETFEINNSLRVSKGLQPLESAPQISSLSEEPDAESELLRTALPYGICAKLLVDDDISRAVYFQNQYALAVKECDRCVGGTVSDVYADIC